jgi:hypothetical protein
MAVLVAWTMGVAGVGVGNDNVGQDDVVEVGVVVEDGVGGAGVGTGAGASIMTKAVVHAWAMAACAMAGVRWRRV